VKHRLGRSGKHTEKLRLWIQNPEAIKPGSLMPAMKLNDAIWTPWCVTWRRSARPEIQETSMSTDAIVIENAQTERRPWVENSSTSG
jgi:hypothetical protein